MSSKILILNEGEGPDYLFPTSVNMRVADKVNSIQTENYELIIDKAGYIVRLGEDKIAFPKKEFELLLLLASNPRKVFKRDEILMHIWGKDYKPKDSRSLDVHIRMLRKKLQDKFITTLRGVGYKLEK